METIPTFNCVAKHAPLQAFNPSSEQDSGVMAQKTIARDLESMFETFDPERLQEIDHFLRALTDLDVTQRDVELMLATVLIWRRSGRGREAYPIGIKAIRCARLLKDSTLLMNALIARGNTANGALDIGTAIECYSEAMQLAESLNDLLYQGRILLNLGIACSQISLDVVSLQCEERALAIAEQLQTDKGKARALECIASCAISASHLQLRDYRAALRVAERCQIVGQHACSHLEPGDRAHVQDAMAASQCCQVMALVRLGAYDAAHGVSEGLDRGNAGNPRGAHALTALAQLNAATGNMDLAVDELRRIISDPLAKQHRRGAMAALVECYEWGGLHHSALLALQELQAEIETARREVAIEDLRRLDGVEPTIDQDFDKTTQSRIVRCLVEIDGLDSRLSSKLSYLIEFAVSAEIREGNEENRAEHIYRVGALSSLLAAEAGGSEELRWLAEIAGRLHDIGKSSVTDAIALKARPLSSEEWQMVQMHADYGARLIADANEPMLIQVVAAVRHHHERFSGGGYPSNLKAEEIPLLARIVAIAEAFDAMLQSRTYRPSRSVRTALEEIERGAGSQFDPRLAGLFVQMVRRLQREVEDLSEYLGAQGRASSTVQTFTKLGDLFNMHRRSAA